MTVKLTEWVTLCVCVSMGDDRQAGKVCYFVWVCVIGRWPSSWQSELLCVCVCVSMGDDRQADKVCYFVCVSVGDDRE